MRKLSLRGSRSRPKQEEQDVHVGGTAERRWIAKEPTLSVGVVASSVNNFIWLQAKLLKLTF
jgi:hypothetical protein